MKSQSNSALRGVNSSNLLGSGSIARKNNEDLDTSISEQMLKTRGSVASQRSGSNVSANAKTSSVNQP